jgi:hypothetical protein
MKSAEAAEVSANSTYVAVASFRIFFFPVVSCFGWFPTELRSKCSFNKRMVVASFFECRATLRATHYLLEGSRRAKR